MLYTSIRSLLVASLMLVAPGALAQAAPDDPGATDARFRDDAAACWAHVDHGSSTVCAVQYAHVVDLRNQVPLTMQRPPEDAGDLAAGFTSTPGYEPVWDLNQVRMAPIGGVEYRDDGLYLFNHGVPGAMLFDPTVPVFGYWSMSADMDESSVLDLDQAPDGSDPGVGALPCLTVQMTIETGRFGQGGEVLTTAQQTKTIVTGQPLADLDDPAVAPHLCTGDREAAFHIDDVVEFEIEMPPIQRDVSPETQLHVQVEWWNHAPGDSDEADKVYLHWWNMHTGPEYAPRVVLPVERLMQVESLDVFADDEAMYVEGLINSAFGAYAVDPETVRLRVFNEDGYEIEVTDAGPTVVRYDYHHHGFPPLRAVLAWNHEDAALPPGTYKVEMSAKDLQGNGPAIAETEFVLLAAVEESPLGVAPLFAVALLALLAAPRRRGT